MDLDAVRSDLEQVVRESDAAIAALHAEEANAEAHEPAGEQVQPDVTDDASDLTENDRAEALVDAANARREEALAALARLDDGTFGSCVDCGKEIGEARLSFRPEASRCLACQELFEEREG